MNSSDLEVGVVIEETEVSMSLGKLGKGTSFLKLAFEFEGVFRVMSV